MSSNDIRVSFECPQIDACPAEMAAFGITLRDAVGLLKPRTFDGLTLIEIGAVIVRGALIDVIPRCGVEQWHLETLVGVAEHAFHVPPRKADGWRYTRQAGDPRWVTFVTVESDEVADVSAAADRSGSLVIRRVA